VRIEANLGCKGLIVLGDTYFPGWYATVDGRAAKVWEVDGLVRGVEVAAGAHVVEMRYSPRSVWLGAGLSLLGLMAACVAGLAKPKNSM
jgi:uncharacterized membrane protein YfhO